MKKTVVYQHSGEAAEFKKIRIMIQGAENCAIYPTLHTHSPTLNTARTSIQIKVPYKLRV